MKLPTKAEVRTSLHDIKGFADLAMKALENPTEWDKVEEWLNAIEGTSGFYRDKIERSLWRD